MKLLNVVGNFYTEGNGVFAVVDSLTKDLNTQINSEVYILTPVIQQSYTYIVYDSSTDFETLLDVNKYDLIIFHGLFWWKYLCFGKICMKKKIPYVIKPHSSLVTTALKKSSWKKGIAIMLFFRKFINNGEALLFINEEEKRHSKNFDKKSYIEPNGLSLGSITTYKHHSTLDSTNLMFFSRIDYSHKGIGLLLHAFDILSSQYSDLNIHLNIYGRGSQKEVNRLQRDIKKLSNVTYHGAVYGENKYKAMSENDIMILTSRYEGFPTVFIESLKSGLPLIVTPGTNATYLTKFGIAWKSDDEVFNLVECIKHAVEEYREASREYKIRCVNVANQLFEITEISKVALNNYVEIIMCYGKK